MRSLRRHLSATRGMRRVTGRTDDVVSVGAEPGGLSAEQFPATAQDPRVHGLAAVRIAGG